MLMFAIPFLGERCEIRWEHDDIDLCRQMVLKGCDSMCGGCRLKVEALNRKF
jgi:hypothetical protein